MSGIVFKQRFNPVSSEKTPGLNVRHLQYISTRPGTVYNRGCGFGLWGRVPGARQPEDMQNLDAAKELLREVSQRRTVYRAVISVGAKDAEQNGLYDRAAWEQLTRQHIAAISKQMGIDDKDFCYLVSMHQARGHPHIHIMYWDNGDQPRPEFMPKARFERIAEAVRADWNRDICAAEISESRDEQGRLSKQLRTQLQAMCLEANPSKALDLHRLVTSPKLPALANDLWKLVENIPSNGSLKYRYLPPEYKNQLNAFLDKVLDMPEMKGVYDQYLTSTDALSAAYGNGEETTAQNREKAVQKLYTNLGNEVMNAIREIIPDLERLPPEAKAVLKQSIAVTEDLSTGKKATNALPKPEQPSALLAREASVPPEMLRAQPHYDAALQAMPKERIPTSQLYQIPEFRQELYALTDVVLKIDPVLRGQVSSAARQAAQVAEDAAQTEKDIRKAYSSAVRRQAVSLLRTDAGYDEEMRRTYTASTLQKMFCLLSQLGTQRQAQGDQLEQHRKFPRQKSKEESKNIRARLLQRGGWTKNFTGIEP